MVAPLVGAWIEILMICQMMSITASLPSWERGLKFVSILLIAIGVVVAPLVGAWIEIFRTLSDLS